MLKKILGFIILIFFFQQVVTAQNDYEKSVLNNSSIVNPLAKFSIEWNKMEYSNCNTAKDLTYLSAAERDVIWILNMVRLNPSLFLKSVLLNPQSSVFKKSKERGFYYNSLVENLKTLIPNSSPLLPDTNLFLTAKCHAYESGKIGYVGHERKNNTCEKDFYGECCYYGLEDPFHIVISLLIDERIRDFGHRKIMLSNKYSLIGVSLQPHIDYGTNTVLDFK